MEPHAFVAVVDAAAERELEAPVEALDVGVGRLRHDHGERPSPRWHATSVLLTTDWMRSAGSQ